MRRGYRLLGARGGSADSSGQAMGKKSRPGHALSDNIFSLIRPSVTLQFFMQNRDRQSLIWVSREMIGLM